MADNQQPGLLANILAVAGFIILIVIIVWGAYNLLRLTGSGVSNLFSRLGGSGDIQVTAPSAPVQPERAFPLSWQHEPAEEGTYAFLYQCNEDFRFDLQTPADTTIAVPCGNAYGVGEATSLSLIPMYSGTDSLEVPLTVVFVPSATTSDERSQGTATITIAAAPAPEPAVPTISTPSPTTNEEPTSAGTAVAGQADLSVRIIAVGMIDTASGVFVERTPGPNDTAAVQFDIRNNGTAASGQYYFSVQLPTRPVYPYTSPAQSSLAPGAHVVSTLRFGPVAPGGGTIAIEVDSKRAAKDADRSNNTVSVWMNAATYPYYYQAPFVY